MGQLHLQTQYEHLSEGGLFNHLLFEADRLRRNPEAKQIALSRLKWLMDRLIQLALADGQLPQLSPLQQH